MIRLKALTSLMLIVLLFAVLLAACAGTDKVTRVEGKAPHYTSVEDALAAATDGQFVVVDFYTDW
ncbi:MAG: hypothetical protein GY867_04305 [bacterium]|nr:hypothetical protein [bacterium]